MPLASTDLLDPQTLDRVRGLALVARRVVEGALHGLHRSRQHGLSVEFAQHRPYTPGDELRHLDWQVLARSDRYVIRQYQQETNLRVLLYLDCSASMAYSGATTSSPSPAMPSSAWPGSSPTKFTHAQRLAAALAHLMLHQGDSVGLNLLSNIDQQLPGVAPKAAPGHVLSICHALVTATPAGTTNLPAGLLQLASRLKRRSVIILISDLLDDPDATLAALGQLHHRGHEVIIFQILDRRELDFDFNNHPGVTVIRDMETDAEFEAEPHLIRRLVQQQVQRFCDTLDAGARSRGLHLLRTTTDTDVGLTLSRYLHHRAQARPCESSSLAGMGGSV